MLDKTVNGLRELKEGLAGGNELLTVVLTSLIVLVLLPTLYASFYVSYRDVFVSIDENV